ncbi:unnamed protein product [Owenia fusiformis]|uniref:Uncharacterized protein n=1 Tax=Owenia fusiformis TaxID=6347 RepID=A0A8J1TPU3_OWEFU|nr:unnamed protein product [Owenia fusiformis]
MEPRSSTKRLNRYKAARDDNVYHNGSSSQSSQHPGNGHEKWENNNEQNWGHFGGYDNGFIAGMNYRKDHDNLFSEDRVSMMSYHESETFQLPKTFRNVISSCANRTSVQGVPNINNSKSMVQRVGWSLLFIAACVVTVEQLYEVFDKYYSYDKNTVISLEYQHIRFPSITICNQNAIRKDKLHLARPELKAFLENYMKEKPFGNRKKRDVGPQPLGPSSTPSDSASIQSATSATPNSTFGPNGLNIIPTNGPNGQEVTNDSNTQMPTSDTSTQRLTNNPNIQGDINNPNVQGDINNPNVQGDINNPNVQGDINNPNIQGDINNPNVQGDINNPNVQGDINNPNIQGDIINPNVQGDTDLGQSSSTFPGQRQRVSNTTFLSDKFNSFRFEEDGFEGLTEDAARDLFEEYQYLVHEESDETRQQMGHQGNSFIQSCSFNGYECEASNFEEFLNTEYGNCFTFNNKKSRKGESLRSTKAGYQHGLNLVLYLDGRNYMPGITQGSGAILVVHEFDTTPYPSQAGIAINVGTETRLALKMVDIKRLGGIYGDCTFDSTWEKDYGALYTQQSCIETCQHRGIMELCGCHVHGYKEYYPIHFRSNGTLCETDAELLCAFKLKRDYLKGNYTCDCNQPCDERIYEYSTSSNDWPHTAYEDTVKELGCSDDVDDEKICEDVSSPQFNVRDDYLSLRLFYQTLNYESIEEELDYSIANFLSDIGGTVGLWIGASVLTAVEGLEMVALLFVFFYRKCKRWYRADQEYERKVQEAKRKKREEEEQAKREEKIKQEKRQSKRSSQPSFANSNGLSPMGSTFRPPLRHTPSYSSARY